MAIIRTESNFNPALYRQNAQGLMQLIPETAERFNVRKPFDPEQNIRGGMAYCVGCWPTSRGMSHWSLQRTTREKAR